MIRAVIVDDELPSLQKLEKLLLDSGLASVVGAFTHPHEALAFLREKEADAVFLDIETPDMNGIELAARLPDLRGNLDVVFVTAYNQYALEAFRLNAADYLLKPVTEKRLLETLARLSGGKGGPEGANTLTARCFGKFQAGAGGAEIRFRTEKAEELLAFLIDQRSGFVSRGKILDNLWEDFDGDRAVIHFNTTLHYMKKALLRQGVQLSIQYDRGSYRLTGEGISCDYFKFCALAEKAGAAPRQEVSALEEAAALYTGEYLSGWDCSWAVARRLHLEERYIGLVMAISAHYKAAGEYRRAAGWLREGLLQEPLHRELNFALVELLLLAHENVMAAKQYVLYRSGLQKKLGIEPDEAFKKLLPRL